MNNILKAWNAGFVKRWHTNPRLCDSNDYDSGHQHRCTILLLLFWPDSSRSAIIDCLIHDQGEIDAGDISHPAKQKHPILKETSELIERESIKEQGFTKYGVTDEELDRRRFIDYLDSYVWMLRSNPKLRSHEEWVKHLDELEEWGSRLGIRSEYLDFITEAHHYYT